MIEVNLLKQKPVVHGIPSDKEGAKLVGVVFVFVVIGALLTVGLLKMFTGERVKEETSTYTNNMTPAETAPVQESSVPLKDSISDTPTKVVSDTRYEEMSMLERLSYEQIYAYYLFRELSLIVPSDVDFTQLGFTKYSSVYGEGGVDSEKGVVSLFSALKEGKGWELLPKPTSLFRSLGDGYQFKFKAEYKAQPDQNDISIITSEKILSLDHLQNVKDEMEVLLKNQPITVTENLTLLDTKFEGKYRSYLYTVKGRSSFHQFLQLLREIKMNKSAVSVAAADLKAHNGGLNWSITIKITVM